MKRFLGFLMALSVAVHATPIDTVSIDPKTPAKVTLSTGVDTVVQFPATINGAFGLGLVTDSGNQNAGQGGIIAVQHPGPNLLVLHSLRPDAHCLMTVLMDGKLYLIALETGADPNVSLTLVKAEGAQSIGKEITPVEVKAMRPKMEPALYEELERRATKVELLKPNLPSLYQGYSTRPANSTSDAGSARVTVTRVSRFSDQDAVVVEGTVRNETGQPLKFDGRAVQVLVASELHPAKWVHCQQPVPPGESVAIVAVIQGTPDGLGRANLALANEFRIQLPASESQTASLWDVKNGQFGTSRLPTPKAAPVTASIPRTQTGRPVQAN
jgi:hypothetical protein